MASQINKRRAKLRFNLLGSSPSASLRAFGASRAKQYRLPILKQLPLQKLVGKTYRLRVILGMEGFSTPTHFNGRPDVFAPAREVSRQMRELWQLENEVTRVELGQFSTDWPRNDFENDLLETIERTGAGLRLSRAPCFVWHVGGRGELGQTTLNLYRLDSPRHHAYLQFEVRPFRAGYEIHTKILAIEPAFQGNFFNLRDFLDRVFATLLNGLRRHAVYRIWGRLLENDLPLRAAKKRGGDWRYELTPDGQTKLAKLYERLGAVRLPYADGGAVCVFSRAAWKLFEWENPQEAAHLQKQVASERKRNPAPKAVEQKAL